ncbi:MAG: inactive transglutaminase family protein [Gammaproteobacteria bacterium]
MQNFKTILLVLALVLVAAFIMHTKVTSLGLPILPDQQEPVWSVEAKISFEPTKRGTIVSLDIPDQLGDYVVLEEYFVARQYGLNIENLAGDRRAEWSTRKARNEQRLFYRVEFAPNASRTLKESQADKRKSPAIPEVPIYGEPLASAVEDLLDEVRGDSANVFTFVSQLIVKLTQFQSDSNIKVVRGSIVPGSKEWVDRIIYVLAGARINARMVRGIILQDGATEHSLLPWLEVHNGERWAAFDPISGSKGLPANFVRWTTGSHEILSVENGKNEKISFAISSYIQPLAEIAKERADAKGSWLRHTMLFDLPVGTQNVYRTLLMIPLGALIVSLMRTVIGVPTLGTFMPILIAIAFRETDLFWGIFLFTLISGLGLIFRFYLERLQLLLVPRLCAVLIVVVLMMLAISLFSANFGLARGFSIALFPIVILTMVIEHMSIVWEVSGAIATFKEALGSLVVAILGYLAMVNEYLSHLIFLFPEVLLVVLALSILIGRYTGYRVTELFRFKDILTEQR